MLPEARFDAGRLKRLMTKKSIGDTELARKAGVSRQMIFHLRKGSRQTASAEVVQKMADALDTTVPYLLGDDEGEEESIPETIAKLLEIVEKLSETRQEELVRIANAFRQLEDEESQSPFIYTRMLEMLRSSKVFGPEEIDRLVRGIRAERGTNDQPGRWLIDLGAERPGGDEPAEHGADDPTEGE